MKIFKKYGKEFSTVILLSFLQGFVFEFFIAYAQPAAYNPVFADYVYYGNASAEYDQPLEQSTGFEEYTAEAEEVLSAEPVVKEEAKAVPQSVGEKDQSIENLRSETEESSRAESTVLYPADLAFGIIGSSENLNFDNPEDNLFKIAIAEAIDYHASYVLSYEVYGMSTASGVAKSINTATSTGGFFTAKKQEWSRISEFVSPHNLKEGINTVLFTGDLKTASGYLVRNVQLEKRQEEQQEPFKLNDVVKNSQSGEIYVSGVVSLSDPAVSLYVSGEEAAFQNYNFEHLVSVSAESEGDLTLELKKGEKLLASRRISAQEIHEAENIKSFDYAFTRFESEVHTGEEKYFQLENVTLTFPAESYSRDFTLSVQELRTSDYAPTGMALRNVTQNNSAYRFLPDGIRFDKEVELKLKYDETAIPTGYSAKDIQVFYFDTEIKQWTRVKVTEILEETQEVVAVTNHFTDYLAGVIQEPESPETNAFAPTTITGIQAANPTENIPMVSVPQINDKGDAVLTFPLMLPPARQGMVPDLSVNYNSSADEGDFGLGWSLSVPTISVDTRWGVPTYDSAKETESYLFNGEELLLVKPDKTMYVPHKDILINRVSNAVFQKAQHDPSVEITRIGNSPNDYYWIVKDSKTGWNHLYREVGKGEWLLREVSDMYGNSMRYNYSAPKELGEIIYNKNNNLNNNGFGDLSVKIIRRNWIDTSNKSRMDVKTNNRFGIEKISQRLIDKIIVHSAEIELDAGRCVFMEYDFVYKEGKFGRSLLHKIIHSNYNNNDTPCGYNTNTDLTPIVQEYSFDYHDDIGSGGLFESSGKTINTYKDYETEYDSFKVYISALGGSEGKSSHFGGGASGGIVTPIFPASWLPFSRAATIGGNLGGGSSNSETKVLMADIDGDGLPDKIFKGGKKFFYRKNLGGKFSEEVKSIKNLPNLSYTKGNSSDDSYTINILAGSVTKSTSESRSTVSTYTADVNADGLLDVVDNERVYFGYIDPQTKQPAFNLDSSVTPAIVLKEDDVAPVLNPMPEMGLTNGPMDLVMVWRAPKNGTVTATGIITKQHIALQSGVKFSIEKLHESNMGEASFILGPNLMLSGSESHNNTINVVKGDLLFFRVHTNQIPLEELGVTWNPKVSYTGPNLDPVLTSSRHTSSYQESFIVGANYEETFKKNGQYRLEWAPFSLYDVDRVTIKVSYYKKDTNNGGNIPASGSSMVLYEKTSDIQTTTAFPSPNLLINMNSIMSNPTSFHYIKVEVLSDSEIDWKDIDTKFKPKLTSLDTNNEDLYLIPYYSNYSRVYISNPPLTFISSGANYTVTINNNFTLPGCTEEICKDRYVYLVAKWPNGDIIGLVNSSGSPTGYCKYRYKIDKYGKVIQKQRLNASYVYENIGNTDNINLTGRAVGEKFFFEYYSPEYNLAERLDAFQNNGTNNLIRIQGTTPYANYVTGADSNGKVKASIYSSENTAAWGNMFRNWGQFAYKGAEIGEMYQPIMGKHIHVYNPNLTTNTGRSVDDMVTDTGMTLDDVDNNFDDLKELGGNVSVYFGMLMPEKKRNRWQSHEHLYVSDSKISPYIRFLTDDIPDLKPPTVPVNNFGAYGINKYTYFKNNTTNKSLGFLMVNVGNTKTSGSSELLNEFMDINGDGFPDIIGKQIQLTAKRGGLSSKIVNVDFNTQTAISGSGSLVGGSSAGIKGSPLLSENSKLNIIVGDQGSGSLSSSSFNTTNATQRFYVDINGDGLVDIAQDDGKVFLNYGGTFTESTTWSSLPVQESSTRTGNGGGGFGFSGISNMDLSFGVSISSSTSKDKVTYMDLNGDGLPEKIVNGTTYYLNLGTKFDTVGNNLPGAQTQKSTEAGLNGNGTVCVYFPTIFLVGPKLCVSFGGGTGRNISSEESRYMDFDGDGYPDYVTSTKNESMTVYHSRIKRTNLLKKVIQSTGAEIELDYAVTNPVDKSVIGSTYKMPYKKWVLTKVSVFDGFTGDGEDITRYAYEYFNGYKDRKERNFMGFGMTKAHLLDKDGWAYRTDVTEYLLNDMTENELYRPGTSSDLKQYIYKKGLPKKTYTLDRTQRLMNETQYTYKFYDSGKVTGDINTTATSAAEVSVYTEKMSVLPLVTKVKNKVVNFDEDSTNSSFAFDTEQRFNLYDKKGNVKKYVDVDRGLTVDIQYSLLQKTLPISHRISTTSGNQTLRLTESTVVNGVQITEVRKYFTDTQYVKWNYEYDFLGNLTKKIFPEQNGQRFFYEYHYEDHSRHSYWDVDFRKVFPSFIRDSFGNEMYVYYNIFGLPMEVKDIYGVEMRYKYDYMNRLIEFKGPYETDWTIKNEYLGNRRAVTSHNLGQGVLYTGMINDGLGRTVQTKKLLKQSQGNNPACGTGPFKNMNFVVSGDVIYDEFGRVIENYLSEEEEVNCLPAGASTTPSILSLVLTTYYNSNRMAEKKTSRLYDNKDRITEELVYGINARTKTKYAFGPDKYGATAFTHEITLPEGNKTVTYTNKLGLTTSQKQIDNSTALWTNFEYDNLGQIKKVENALGLQTTYSYDRLGRVLQKILPAAGITKFKYDDLGNVIEKEDANGTKVMYAYNFNRLTKIINPTITTDFTYEQGGRLKKMEDLSGYHEFVYGKLGEVVEDTKMIRDIAGGEHFFKSKYKYDSWGRLLEMVYPDQEKVFYNYNSIGQLIEIQNENGEYYLKNVKYNYFDQPYYIKYGNGVEMTQEFDLTERLRAAQLSAPDMGNPNQLNVFSRNVYGYDKNNNVTSMYNNFSQHNNVVVGGTYIKTYSYDKFNRLQTAQGNWDGLLETHDFMLNMEYREDHSIQAKHQTHMFTDKNTGQLEHTENSSDREYGYDATTSRMQSISGYHHGEGAFEKLYYYDNNGNMTRVEYPNPLPFDAFFVRGIDWDANNNITQINDNQSEVINTYLYDGKGERVVKRQQGSSSMSINGGGPVNGMYGTEEVLYPSGNLTYNENMYTKHYYINGKRLASRIEDSSYPGHFMDKYFNQNEVSPHETGGMMRMQVSMNNSNSSTQNIGGIEPFPTISPQICENQINILLNVLYNTPEKIDCKNAILAILENHKVYGGRCKEFAPANPPGSAGCLEWELYVTGYNYCDALEEINALGCIERTPDGMIIDPSTGYVYDPLTGLPHDPITGLPIDLGLIGNYNPVELECYNKFLNFIDYYKNRTDKPAEYFELIQYLICLDDGNCWECIKLPHTEGTEVACFVKFCELNIPDIEEEEEEVETPTFPVIVLDPGVNDTWDDEEPARSDIVADPMAQEQPVWWYHSDHLGSTSYITDILGKPCQYIEYLPFGEVMVQQSTNNIFENVYKFNAKELDESTGYYYYGARYYDPAISIFLSVDPLAEQFPNYNPYTYTMNNPVNLTDPTGMAPEGAGDPDKQPQQSQKLLNIKIYGQDKSLYYEGKPFSFGKGGFRFYSEKGSQGDLSLLKGNSGEGELINADLIYAFANYTKGYGVGNTYKTVKQGAEFVGNIFEAFDKGQNIVEDINRNIDASRTNKTTSPNENTSGDMRSSTVSSTGQMKFTLKGYRNKDMFNKSNEAVTRWKKDTIIDIKDFKQLDAKNKSDSLYNAQKGSR
ncbi:RHS repeat-associated core domain-containing protein [Myroides indicus]|uniref:RHS repeat-associated protein n=1 Tax=Myroides indicus TaxID=1323422 RepID=A0A4V3E842_9FLAO|nr:RHS repeat-associated core domain-containing protein [Myroides indicus]TDS56950.1 RHS repeat-associated protein [Myroides indicus]